MKKIKYFILISVISGGLFFLFGPEVIPENLQWQELPNLTNYQTIIIFNSGGWGNTLLEEAKDFVPIVEGIQQTLNNWGYHSIVIPHIRTKDNFLGKISGSRDFLNSFPSSSQTLAEKVEFLTKNFPEKKIIITGLSSGGALVNETIKKISEKTKNSICAITVGAPFWSESPLSENLLQLNNNQKDSLAVGEIKALVFSLIKAPFKWVSSKFNGQNLTFSQAIQPPGHQYSWFKVEPDLVSFLEDKFEK